MNFFSEGHPRRFGVTLSCQIFNNYPAKSRGISSDT